MRVDIHSHVCTAAAQLGSQILSLRAAREIIQVLINVCRFPSIKTIRKVPSLAVFGKQGGQRARRKVRRGGGEGREAVFIGSIPSILFKSRDVHFVLLLTHCLDCGGFCAFAAAVFRARTEA